MAWAIPLAYEQVSCAVICMLTLIADTVDQPITKLEERTNLFMIDSEMNDLERYAMHRSIRVANQHYIGAGYER